MTAPTIEWVVETGIPIDVAILNHTEEPTKAQAMVIIREAGSFLKIVTSTILFLIVSETLEPAKTAPNNSQSAAKIMACQYFKDLEETEDAKELATSLAPIFQASKNAKSIPMAKI